MNSKTNVVESDSVAIGQNMEMPGAVDPTGKGLTETQYKQRQINQTSTDAT